MGAIAQKAYELAPSWLKKPWGQRLVYALTLPLDVITEWIYQGVRARFPLVGTPTAYAALGRDRGIVRGPSESDEHFAERLMRWLDDWHTAGGPHALLNQIAGFLGATPPKLSLVWHNPATDTATWVVRGTDGVISTHRESPTNFDWDSETNVDSSNQWARFFIVIHSDAGNPWDPAADWGGGTAWKGGQLWGFTGTPLEIAGLRQILDDWRPAHAICPWVIVAFDAASFNPTGSGAGYPDGWWGKWHKVVGGVAVPSRLVTARYFRGSV
jgi:hypothetical protein